MVLVMMMMPSLAVVTTRKGPSGSGGEGKGGNDGIENGLSVLWSCLGSTLIGDVALFYLFPAWDVQHVMNIRVFTISNHELSARSAHWQQVDGLLLKA